MRRCLFCEGVGPFDTPEHIIPEAIGNDGLLLVQEVCDTCNQYFGRKVESFVLNKTPIAFWRTYLGIKGKRGKLPHVELSQLKKQKGKLPATHHLHDNSIGFSCHPDFSVSCDLDDDSIVREIIEGKRNQFTFVFTPLVLVMMGRFLCKIGVELLCSDDPRWARASDFAQARRFARFGDCDGLWPVFHARGCDLKDLRTRQGTSEEIQCFSYRLLEVKQRYVLLELCVGTDMWIVSLNDPFPHPVIREAFPGRKLNLIWYGTDQMKMNRDKA